MRKLVILFIALVVGFGFAWENLGDTYRLEISDIVSTVDTETTFAPYFDLRCTDRVAYLVVPQPVLSATAGYQVSSDGMAVYLTDISPLYTQTYLDIFILSEDMAFFRYRINLTGIPNC